MSKDYFGDGFIQYINSKISELLDIYQMESFAGTVGLYEQFSYLLICRLIETYSGEKTFYWLFFLKEYFIENEKLHYLEEVSDEEVLLLAHNMIVQLVNAAEYSNNPSIQFLKNAEITIRSGTIIRRMLNIIDDLISGIGTKVYPISQIMGEFLVLCHNRERSKGYYITPSNLADFVINIINMEPERYKTDRRTIFNPLCGTGSLLIYAVQKYKDSIPVSHEDNVVLKNSIALNYMFHDVEVIFTEDNHIYQQGSKEKYDIVLSNPPFSTKNIEDTKTSIMLTNYPLKYTKQEYQIQIVKILESIAIGGRGAIIVPDSFLFASTQATQEVRKWILENYLIEGIVSLPSNVFYPLSSAKASILFISKPQKNYNKEYVTDKVFFYTVETMQNNKKAPDLEKAFIDLCEIWNKKELFYEEWEVSLNREASKLSNILTPNQWAYEKFWFADIGNIQLSDWSLLPKKYQPIKQLNMIVESPVNLMEELIQLQEEILKDMWHLHREVDKM